MKGKENKKKKYNILQIKKINQENHHNRSTKQLAKFLDVYCTAQKSPTLDNIHIYVVCRSIMMIFLIYFFNL